MAQVIAVAQQKGGAGKTMLAVQLGVAFAATLRVGLLDIDPQGSLSAWGALRRENARAVLPLTIERVSGWRLAATLEALRRDHDIVLIDTPPVIEADARRAIRGADLVLIPLNPAPVDLWAAEGTLKLAADERRRAVLVFNRAATGSKLRRRLESEIGARGLVLLDQALGNRAAYANSFADGFGVAELAAGSAACVEVVTMAAALLKLLGMSA